MKEVLLIEGTIVVWCPVYYDKSDFEVSAL